MYLHSAFYLAPTVTLPLSIAAVFLFLCVIEAVVIFYLLGKKNAVSVEETPDTRTASASAESDAKDDAPDEEDLAVILSVMCEELNARPEELEFKEIRLVS